MRNFFLSLCLILPCFLIAKDGAKFSPGCIVYEFANGQIECLSEIDENKHLSVYIAPLKSNTRFQFSSIHSQKGKTILVGMMFVEEDTDLCASWTNAQEITLSLNTKKVITSTLNGKVLYDKNNITVYTK